MALTSIEELALLERAKSFAREENAKIQNVLRTAGTPLTSTSVTNATTTQGSTPTIPAVLPNLAIFNRIYVGSIFFDLTESEIEAVFSVFGSVKSVLMVVDPATKRHKGYGFIEFETADAAALAQLAMDNAELGGRHIKVGRPNNFPSDLPPGVPRPLPNRIYITNIHELIQEEEIRAIFEAFGPLRHCNLTPNSKILNQHRGYGYVEYEVVADAINAMNSLNNFELAGKQLKIGKTIFGGPIPIGMKDAKIISQDSTDDSDSKVSTDASLVNQIKLPSAVLRAAQQINAALGTDKKTTVAPKSYPPASSRWGQGPLSSPSQDSAVMKLTNLVDVEEVQDEQSTLELLEDVSSECSKFGPLAEIVQLHVSTSTQKVSIFVKYSSSSDCSEAIRRMDSRWFGGRQITATLFPIELFDSRDFE